MKKTPGAGVPGPRKWGFLLRPTAAALAVVAAFFFAAVFVSTAVGTAGVVLLFLLGVVVTGVVTGGLQGFFAAGAFALLLPYFFLPPVRDFGISSPADVELFALFVPAGFASALLVSRLKTAASRAEDRARRADLMHRLGRDIAGAGGRIAVLSAARQAMREVLDDRIDFYVPEGRELLRLYEGDLIPVDEHYRTLPDWVFAGNEPAGRGTRVMDGADSLYLPLHSEGRTLGVMGVRCADPREYFSRDKRLLLEAVAAHIASALRREESAANGHQENLLAEGERLRASLLRSISHDLRTPLTSIVGSAGYLLEKHGGDSSTADREMLANIRDEAAWLSRMVDNILSLTRFESEKVLLRKESESVEDVFSSALRVLAARLAHYRVSVRLPDYFLLVPMESSLIEQVLVNLLDNAMKYSGTGSEIDISVESGDGEAVFEVADRGRGVPPGDRERIFEKFERGTGEQTRGVRGSGLGLSICRAIVEAHGGRIHAFPRDGGGSRFIFTLPLEVESHG